MPETRSMTSPRERSSTGANARVALPMLLALVRVTPLLSQSAPVVETIALTESLVSRGRLGGVSVASDGTLFVSNFGATTWRISTSGEVEVVIEDLRGSSGNALGPGGDLFQASFLDNRIVRVGSDGTVEDYVIDGLNGPVGLAAMPDGTLFVCNCRGNSISRVDAHGHVSRFATHEALDCPNGITADPAGNLYVVSFNNGTLARVRPNGTVEVVAEIPAGRNAHVAYANGALYVTKIESNRVYRVSEAGLVEPFAGTGELGFDDGQALQATLARPNGIASSADGATLYLNTLRGEWRGEERTEIVLRRIRLGG